MERKGGTTMNIVIFFGLFMLFLAFAIFTPNINSSFLGVNLSNAGADTILIFKAAFVIIALGFLAGVLEEV